MLLDLKPMLFVSMTCDLVRVAKVAFVDAVWHAFGPRAAPAVVVAERISSSLCTSDQHSSNEGMTIAYTVAFGRSGRDVASPLGDCVLEVQLTVAFRVEPALQGVELDSIVSSCRSRRRSRK